MRWFYYQMAFHGGWVPVLSAERPTKAAEGKGRAVCGVRELDTKERRKLRKGQWTIDDIAARHPVGAV